MERKGTEYTNEELERAMEYLRQRLDTERLIASAVSQILEECAETLVDFIIGGATDEELDMVIESLANSILEWIDNLSVETHDRRDILLLWLHNEWNDGILEDVVRKRSYTFYDEVAVVCSVGELLHRSKSEIIASVKSSMRDPWNNPLIVEARQAVSEGKLVLPDGLDLDERHYGQGIPISSLTGLEKLSRSAVGASWVWWQYMDEKDKGAKGFFIVRGSSYPCPYCDDVVAHGFYRITDEMPVPVHANCVCAVVYSYVERL